MSLFSSQSAFDLLNQAYICCQQGNLIEAKKKYEKLLVNNIRYEQVLTNLGTIELQIGNLHKGIELLKESIELNEKQPLTLSNLGNGLFEIRDYKGALDCFNKAIEVDHYFYEAYYNKGRALKSLQNFEEALESYQKSFQLNPNYILPLINMGVVYSLLHRYDEALSSYAQALKLNPNYNEIYYNQGITLHALHRYDEALSSYAQALKLNPNYSDAFNNQGITLHALHRYDEALSSYAQALKLNPNYSDAFNNQGITLHALHRYDEALSSYAQALKLNPNYSDAFNNQGITLHALHRYDEALSSYAQALKLNPNYSDAFNNQGITLHALHRYDEALSSYAQALKLNPNYSEAIYNLGILKLDQKYFIEGWNLYNERLRIDKYKIAELKNISKPIFSKDFNGKKVLIIPEQGLGDQILFSSLLNEFGRFNNHLLVVVHHKLLKLLKKSFEKMIFISIDSQSNNLVYDAYLPFANIGEFTRPTLESFKNQPKKFLHADEALTSRLKLQLKEEGKYICGIAWKSKNEDFGQNKSVALESLLPILKLPHMTFVNLQYGDTKEEIEALHETHGIQIKIIDEIDNFNDIDELASLIDACDFVVTTSNVTVHLAGGLGKETYLMVPFAQGRIWYWHEDDTQSIWYPSVNIHRQPDLDNWSKPIDKIAHILENKKIK